MNNISQEQLDELVELALRAREKAYAPYSGYRVGAAVLTSKRQVFVGTNVENVSYGLTNCAERAAVFAAAVSEGPKLRIEAFAVVAEKAGEEVQCSPCGACRQVISQFGEDIIAVFRWENGLTKISLSDLLPLSSTFGRKGT